MGWASSERNEAKSMMKHYSANDGSDLWSNAPGPVLSLGGIICGQLRYQLDHERALHRFKPFSLMF